MVNYELSHFNFLDLSLRANLSFVKKTWNLFKILRQAKRERAFFGGHLMLILGKLTFLISVSLLFVRRKFAMRVLTSFSRLENLVIAFFFMAQQRFKCMLNIALQKRNQKQSEALFT